MGAGVDLAQPGLVQGADRGLVLQPREPRFMVMRGDRRHAARDGDGSGGHSPDFQERAAGGGGGHGVPPHDLIWWKRAMSKRPAWRALAPTGPRVRPWSPQ